MAGLLDNPGTTGRQERLAVDPYQAFFRQIYANPELKQLYLQGSAQGSQVNGQVNGGDYLYKNIIGDKLNGIKFNSADEANAAVSSILQGVDPAQFGAMAKTGAQEWQKNWDESSKAPSFFGMNPDTVNAAMLLAISAGTADGLGAFGGGSSSAAAPSSTAFGGPGAMTGANVLGAGDLALTAMPQVTAGSLGLTSAEMAGLGAAGGAEFLGGGAMDTAGAASSGGGLMGGGEMSGAAAGGASMSSNGLSVGMEQGTKTGLLSGVGQFLKDNPTLATAGLGLLGAAAAGQDTKTEATSQKDPWKPAQPYLLDNLKKNAALQEQYAQNPFNDAQKTAYQNSFNNSDNFRNNVAPGLLNMVNSFQPYQRQQTAVGGGYKPAAQTGLLSPNMQAPQGGSLGQVDWSQFLPKRA